MKKCIFLANKMSKIPLLILFVVITLVIFNSLWYKNIRIEFDALTTKQTDYKLFYETKKNQSIDFSHALFYRRSVPGKFQHIKFVIPEKKITAVRLDFSNKIEGNVVTLKNLKLNDNTVPLSLLSKGKRHDVQIVKVKRSSLTLKMTGVGPYIIFPKKISNVAAINHVDYFSLFSILTLSIFFGSIIIFRNSIFVKLIRRLYSTESGEITYIEHRRTHFGLELLRIVSMILIVSFHYLLHSGLWYQIHIPNGILAGYLRPFDVGVNCFVLISGFFLVNSTSGFSFEKLCKLWKPVVFYSVAFFLLRVFYFQDIDFTGLNLFKTLLPIRYKAYWFISNYFCMYLLSPFLGKLARSLTQKEYLKFIGVLLVTFSFYSFFRIDATPFGVTALSVSWFITLYFIGGYFRRFPVRIKQYEALSIYVIFALLTGCMRYMIQPILKLMQYDENNYIFMTSFNSPFFFFSSVGLFLFFVNLYIENSLLKKAIVILAPLTLDVYLIHENPVIYQRLWTEWLHCQDYFNSPIFLLHWLCVVTAVFFICSGIGFVRLKLFRLIERLASGIFSR